MSGDVWMLASGGRRWSARHGSADVEAGGEKAQVPESAPQGSHARHAVSLAPQVTTQTSDPAYGLLNSGRSCQSSELRFGEAQPQRLPFVLGQNRRARRIRFYARQVAQSDDPNGHCRVQDGGFDQPFGILQFELFDLAAA